MREVNAEQALGIKEQATEETLQSIADTLKRIETILLQGQEQTRSCTLDVQGRSLQKLIEN